jgi:hypothetical protein
MNNIDTHGSYANLLDKVSGSVTAYYHFGVYEAYIRFGETCKTDIKFLDVPSCMSCLSVLKHCVVYHYAPF